MTMAQKTRYTVAEFWELVQTLPDDKQYELIDGELMIIAPSSNKNLKLAGLIIYYLLGYVIPNDAGHVMGSDGGYPLDNGTVVIPDVSFVSKAHAPDDDLPEDYSPPDIAIEIISKSETPRKVTDKTERYLNAGTSLVWNVHPDEKIIEVWRSAADGGMNVQSYGIEDTTTGGNVLPQFRLKLADIFKKDE